MTIVGTLTNTTRWLVAALASIATFSANAENCVGRYNNFIHTLSTVELAKGHTQTSFIFSSITTSDNSPMNAAGECSGYALTTPDGKTRVTGICSRKTKDGDSFSDAWVLEPGADKGTFKLVGGTGVFAGKTWSGWWQGTLEDGKMASGKFGCN